MYDLNVFWDQINKQTIILRNPDKQYFSFAKYDFSWHQGKMNIPVKSYSVFPLVCLYVCTIPVLCNDWLGLFISIFKNCIPFIHHFLEFPIKIFHKSIAANSRSSIDTVQIRYQIDHYYILIIISSNQCTNLVHYNRSHTDVSKVNG